MLGRLLSSLFQTNTVTTCVWVSPIEVECGIFESTKRRVFKVEMPVQSMVRIDGEEIQFVGVKFDRMKEDAVNTILKKDEEVFIVPPFVVSDSTILGCLRRQLVKEADLRKSILRAWGKKHRNKKTKDNLIPGDRVRFQYQKEDGSVSQRKVSVLRVTDTTIWGQDQDGKKKTFKIDRISKLK